MKAGSMKECPFCRESIMSDATKCRYCKSEFEPAHGEPTYRELPGRMIAGVATYVSQALGISVSLVRVIFMGAALLMPPLGMGVYAALWLIVPLKPEDESVLEKMVSEAKCLYQRLKRQPSEEESKNGSAPEKTLVTEPGGDS